MFDIGFSELFLCGIIALLVLGPERLPKAARTLGLIIGKIKRSVSGLQEELERQIRTEELQEKLKDPYAVFMDDIELEAKQQQEQEQNAQPAEPTESEPTEPKPTEKAKE